MVLSAVSSLQTPSLVFNVNAPQKAFLNATVVEELLSQVVPVIVIAHVVVVPVIHLLFA